MKLPALAFAGSLAANAALLVTLAFKPALSPPALRDFFQGLGVGGPHAPAAVRPVSPPGPAPAGEQRARVWSRLQSDDLRTLVANLRAAGFSPAIIKALVSAQIETRFRERMKELVGTVADTPFWKPEPTSSFNSTKFYEAYSQIYRERSRMMREVLGDDYFSTNAGEATAAQIRQYGNLPKAKIDLVQRVNDDYAEMTAQVRSATQGITLPEDREKLALLEKEKRADLAAILSPQELEEYLMHSSPLTNRLRQPLSIMDASEAEFRAIFDIQQKYAEQLYPGLTGGPGITYFGTDTMQQRRDAQKEVNDLIKTALGEARATEFARASTSEFQQLYRLAQREGVATDAAVRAFDLRETAAQESMRIMNDRALAVEAKRSALTSLAQTTRSQLIGALGVNAGNTYVKSATWLAYIERGGGVTLSPDGGTSYRSLPPAGATPPRNGSPP